MGGTGGILGRSWGRTLPRPSSGPLGIQGWRHRRVRDDRPPKVAPTSIRAAGADQPISRAWGLAGRRWDAQAEEHTSELQSPCNLVCRLLLEKKKNNERSVSDRP